ncbi:DUF6193 family natural product biosynthesis protein [Streptomyces anulatus]|uniref:DUF6193 family natural product biosynthesis protein n=1 Tax=Streptomyces anulatus TaxID=1892 RepID=UPI00365897FD
MPEAAAGAGAGPRFSRCTRSPWSRDVPSLFRRRDGRFSVIRRTAPASHRHRCGVAGTAGSRRAWCPSVCRSEG